MLPRIYSRYTFVFSVIYEHYWILTLCHWNGYWREIHIRIIETWRSMELKIFENSFLQWTSADIDSEKKEYFVCFSKHEYSNLNSSKTLDLFQINFSIPTVNNIIRDVLFNLCRGKCPFKDVLHAKDLAIAWRIRDVKVTRWNSDSIFDRMAWNSVRHVYICCRLYRITS